jgi:ketosteroid isomerase-like protein
MTEDTSDAGQVADRFFAAFEKGDVATMIACFSPSGTIWHNYDQISAPAEHSRKNMEQFLREFPMPQIVNVKRYSIPTGVVQQHIFRLQRIDGRKFDQPACVIMRIAGGLVESLDEYVDLSSFQMAMA